MRVRRKRQQKRSGFTAVGAFIFAGGFTLGVQKHFRVRAHLESGNFGVATAKANWPDMPIYVDPDAWPVEQFRDETDFVYCNPPCAPWSNAKGKSARRPWREDPRAECVARSFSLLGSIRPAVWCFESVRQVFTKARDMLDEMTEEAASMGYSTTHVFVAGPEHGVPQHRKRYFMVCHKVRLHVEPPEKRPDFTPGEALLLASVVDDVVCKPPETLRPLIPIMRQGESAKRAWLRATAAETGKVGKKPPFLYDRLHEDRTSFTILGSCNKVHPTKHRLITANEAAALCRFPASFTWTGGANSRFQQIGRGVMPPVAEWLAGVVARSLVINESMEPTTAILDVSRQGVFRNVIG